MWKITKWRFLMKWFKTTLRIQTEAQGLHDLTARINAQLREWGVREGILFIFVQHTSASLVINEDYADLARRDMENFLTHLAPEGESWYEHTIEGRDDSPAHLKTMITHTDLSVPVDGGQMNLGTWQGVFLAEHRHGRQVRKVELRVLGTE